MFLGILAGLFTCALWGLTFVGPRAVMPFSAFDLAACRYGIYSAICILLLAFPRFRPRGLSREIWVAGLVIGGISTVGYFIAISFAVKHAGAVIPPLIVGTMPVLVPIIANIRENTLPWNLLAVPLGMIALGIGVANGATLMTTHGLERASIIEGSLWALLALAIWIGYSLVNAGYLRRAGAPDGLHWITVQALGSGIACLFVLPSLSFHTFATASSGDLMNFVIWAAAMAVTSSLVAGWSWTYASKVLPLALSSQLIIAETIFGMIFGLSFENRLPTVEELMGTLLQVIGVCLAIYAFRRKERLTIAAALEMQ
jgi:drug/metabolite transporter (DMT)-like permease